MFCSNCGSPLGAVAHIANDQLLCENCFLRFDSEQNKKDNPTQTIALSRVPDQQRATASSAIPPENVPEVTTGSVSLANVGAQNPKNIQVNTKNQILPPQESWLFSKFLISGECVLWKRSFSKGLINRHLTYSEMVTNFRAVCVDDETMTMIGHVALKDAVVAVESEHREYQSMHTGFERYGTYTGTSSGSSVTLGNVVFFTNGRVALTLYNIRDPQGLKRLIESSQKSLRK